MFKKVLKNALLFFYRRIFNLQKKNTDANVQSNLKGIELLGNNISVHETAIIIKPKKARICLFDNTTIGRFVEIQPVTDGEIVIGFGTSIQDRNIIIGDVEFGRFCLTAPNVFISSGNHYYKIKPFWYIKDQDEYVMHDVELSKKHSKKVIIEDDVWIGINSVIMSGIKIGKGAIIGSNSVVTKNVEPYKVVAGNPAKVIKERIKFIPQKALNFDIQNDLPHFYAGILTDQKSIKKFETKGGLFCLSRFTLHLTGLGDKITIEICNESNFDVYLVYNYQTILLNSSNIYREISFDSNFSHFHDFMLKASDSKREEYKVFLKSVIHS
jgi:acetyltransferase-like isoleucine patch superfamily enzyme